LEAWEVVLPGIDQCFAVQVGETQLASNSTCSTGGVGLAVFTG